MNELRIIGGTAKGMKLRDVAGDSTRPITDMVKEALFNIIGPDIHNSTIWDLFAGTGSVSIEALSRGATFAKMTDNNRNAIETIRTNLLHTRMAEKAKVVKGDTLILLKHQADRQYDYIYVAPPQYKEIWSDTMKLLDENLDWLSEDGWIIVQIHPREYQALTLEHLEVFDERRYSNTLLVFYQRKLAEN